MSACGSPLNGSSLSEPINVMPDAAAGMAVVVAAGSAVAAVGALVAAVLGAAVDALVVLAGSLAATGLGAVGLSGGAAVVQPTTVTTSAPSRSGRRRAIIHIPFRLVSGASGITALVGPRHSKICDAEENCSTLLLFGRCRYSTVLADSQGAAPSVVPGGTAQAFLLE